MTNQGETESRPGLVCEECGMTSLDGRGWRALIVEELADEEADVRTHGALIAIYCPACAEREFGTGAA